MDLLVPSQRRMRYSRNSKHSLSIKLYDLINFTSAKVLLCFCCLHSIDLKTFSLTVPSHEKRSDKMAKPTFSRTSSYCSKQRLPRFSGDTNIWSGPNQPYPISFPSSNDMEISTPTRPTSSHISPEEQKRQRLLSILDEALLVVLDEPKILRQQRQRR